MINESVFTGEQRVTLKTIRALIGNRKTEDLARKSATIDELTDKIDGITRNLKDTGDLIGLSSNGSSVKMHG